MLAFLFPGQGSQAPGMAADLVDLPEARAILDEADAVLGFSLLFGGVVLARMRALLADRQAEARLRRKAMEAPAFGQVREIS